MHPSQQIWAGSETRPEELGGKTAGLAHPITQGLSARRKHLQGRQGSGPAARLRLKGSGGARK